MVSTKMGLHNPQLRCINISRDLEVNYFAEITQSIIMAWTWTHPVKTVSYVKNKMFFPLNHNVSVK